MRIMDWSSDVCSSDLPLLVDPVPAEARQPPQQRLDAALAVELRRTQVFQAEAELLVLGTDAPVGPGLLAGSDVPDQLVAARDGRIAGVAGTGHEPDRKGLGLGKGVAVRVDLGGRRFMKKQKK